MKTNYLNVQALLLMIMLSCAIAFSSCSKKGDPSNPSIYGTWVNPLADDGRYSCTVVILQNSMTVTWQKLNSLEQQTDYYDSFYDEDSQVITANITKKLYIDENGTPEINENSGTEYFYVKWIDKDHIYINDDFGTLTRQ